MTLSNVERAEQLLEGTGYLLEDIVLAYNPHSDEALGHYASHYCKRTGEPLFDIGAHDTYPLLDLIDMDALPEENAPENGRGSWVRFTLKSVLQDDDIFVALYPDRDDRQRVVIDYSDTNDLPPEVTDR